MVVFLPDELVTVVLPDIGSHDYFNQFQSKAISSFIMLDVIFRENSRRNRVPVSVFSVQISILRHNV